MTRVYWHAGSALTAAEFVAEQKYADCRQSKHDEAHGNSASGGTGIIGNRVRAVDGSVELTLEHADTMLPLHQMADAKRSFAVSVGRRILELGWAAGSRLTARLRGGLASRELSCASLRLTQAGPAPASSNPFRMLRVAADRKAKTPEMLMIELAAAADPDAANAKPDPASENAKAGSSKAQKAGPPLGMRIGSMSAGSFLPLLEIVPGRGVIMRGNVTEHRRIERKPPGSEPSDEQLARAFLRTEAGKKERDRIQKIVDDGLELKIPSCSAIGTNAGVRPVTFSWKLSNPDQDVELLRLKVMAALSPVAPTKAAPAWTEVKRPSKKTTLAKGETIEEAASVSLLHPGGTSKLMLMIAAEADYGLAVVKFPDHA